MHGQAGLRAHCLFEEKPYSFWEAIKDFLLKTEGTQSRRIMCFKKMTLAVIYVHVNMCV